MKKILILGSDYGTLDIVREAKKMGLYVYAMDLMENSPTKLEADESYNISTTDIDKIINLIKEKNIDGILAGASEFNITQVRKVCKKLNMPLYCDSDFAWEVSLNKRLFKDICIENDVSVPKDFDLGSDLDKLEFPVVVKPVDASGNDGISYCLDDIELREAIDKANKRTNDKGIVIEKQVKGKDYTAYYVFANGKASFYALTSDHHNKDEEANIYSLKNITYSNLKLYLEQMDSKIKNTFEQIACREGIAFVDLMFDEAENKFYALEMGYRLGGPVIYKPFDKIVDFNVIEWMIEIALGVKHQEKELPKNILTTKKYVASYNLFSNKAADNVNYINLDEVESLDGIDIDIPKRFGGRVGKYKNIGVIRISVDNCLDVCDKIKKINDILRVEDDNGSNLYIRFKEFEELEDEYKESCREIERNKW